MIGLTAAVYCCFQLSLRLAEGRHLSLSVWRKITDNVLYSTFTNVFFYFEAKFFHLCSRQWLNTLIA